MKFWHILSIIAHIPKGLIQIGIFHFEEHGHFSMLDGYLIFLIQEFTDMKIDLQKKKNYVRKEHLAKIHHT